MENVTFTENENSLVILMNKSNLDQRVIDSAKRFFFLQNSDLSHIPYVTNSEQKEIEKLLEDPDCLDFKDSNIIEI